MHTLYYALREHFVKFRFLVLTHGVLYTQLVEYYPIVLSIRRNSSTVLVPLLLRVIEGFQEEVLVKTPELRNTTTSTAATSTRGQWGSCEEGPYKNPRFLSSTKAEKYNY